MRSLAYITAVCLCLSGVSGALNSLLAATLKVDFNHSHKTSPAWEAFSEEDKDLGRPWSKRFSNGLFIEVIPAGGVSLDSRDRGISDDSGSDPQMWQDFLFANGSVDSNQGLNFRITGLIASATYPVRIWSFDSGSRLSRVSTWNQQTYSFDGRSPPPQSLSQNMVLLNVVADANGVAIVKARVGTPPGPAHNIFINGLEIGDPIRLPEGSNLILLSSSIAYQNDPAGTKIGVFSTLSSTPDQTFTYAFSTGNTKNDNGLFEIIDDQLFTAKALTGIPPNSLLSLNVRSTDENLNAVESQFQIKILGDTDASPSILISEFMADNEGIHLDGDNRAVDWVEIHNASSESVNLAGYSLTDDSNVPNKWMFPPIHMPAGGYLVVYGGTPVVDGIIPNDYQDTDGLFHFNFNLKDSGEFLAIVRPDGRTLESVIEPRYPAQFADISYGLNRHGENNYFTSPSPGKINGNGYEGILKDTLFSEKRGFYDSPIEVSISTEGENTSIRYTLDGSQPTVSRGQLYEGPVPITTTTTLRAIAFREGWRSSKVMTHSYIFVNDVARQPANPSGWPDNWGANGEVNRNDGSRNGIVPADYEMDPRVVENTLPGYGIRDALLDIPSVSIVMSQDDFIRPGSGIYAIPQTRIEKPCSIEYLLPDGSSGFQENCKIEVHGNSSRRPWRMQKHSLRVTFTSDQGAARLNYPLFPESPVSNFNKLVLRACFTDSWGLVSWGSSRYRPNDSQYIRDVWMKKSLQAMGQASSHGNFVHLYVNGLYFGLHNLTERLEDDFFSNHLGGDEQDWEINEDFSSPGRRWSQMMHIDASTPEGFAEIQSFVDMENFADYMLLHFYADSEDWPHHNGYAAANTNSGDGRFRFFVWDQEIVLDKFSWNRYDHSGGVGALFQKLRHNSAFRLLFADQAQKHFSPGGALSLKQNQQRYLNLANQIDKAIVAESARWGDTQASTPYGNRVQQPNPLTNVNHDNYPPAPNNPDIFFTREDSWIVERDNILNHYLPTLHDPNSRFAILSELRIEGLYPNAPAPEFSINPGHIVSGTPIELQSKDGIIYYTLDGTDPRQAERILQTILLNDGAPASAIIPENASFKRDWIKPAFSEGRGWKQGFTGIGYETSPSDYKGFIGLNVAEMRNLNSSVYIRVSFSVANEMKLDDVMELRLDMRYDDGFIAYLNGNRVAQANAPIISPDWNSTARTTNPDSAASIFQSFDITSYKHLLVKGKNLLAIHGLNGSVNSSDLLITPRLVASGPDIPQHNTNAMEYTRPIALSQSALLRARTLHKGEWSALNEAYYILESPAAHDNLVISEIMYHPSDSEISEFIELLNISDQTLSLSGVHFNSGVEFEFEQGTTLPPGMRTLIARSASEVTTTASGINIAGEFQNDTRLANNGEVVELVALDGSMIQLLNYDDRSPWPVNADGKGPSLVLVNPRTNPDPNDPANWRLSKFHGGSPGNAEPRGFTGEPSEDHDADGLPAIAEYYFGTSDLDPSDRTQALTISIESFNDAEIPGNYLTISLLHQTAAQDVKAIIEFSEDLILWSGEPSRVISISETPEREGLERLIFRSVFPLRTLDHEFVRLRFQ
ncbi:lamin tail domain-containing protein [Verrucomicrobia bacterium]|nr:lamin tail domain-containing protein [Verrucomicrobiota bacterium]